MRFILSAKNFFSEHFDFSKKEWLFFLGVLLAGLLLRALFFFSTDLTWDESFHIMLAFKIGQIFLAYPIVFAALILFSLVFLYFVAVNQNIFAAVIFCLVPAIAVFVLGIPITFHPTHPPFFNFFEGTLIALTGLGPELLGKIISTASALLIAFSGFFLAKHLSGKKAAIIAFVLLVLSPYSIFYSTTTYIVMLADALAFLALTVFVIGLEKNSKLVPVAGLFFALAFFTRYTTLMVLLPILVFAFWNKKNVLQKQNVSKFLIFAIIVIGFLIALLPAIFGGLGNFLDWTKANTSDLYVRDFAHYSAFLVEKFGMHPVKANLLFFVTEIPAFYSIVLPALFIIAVVFFAKQKRKNILVLAGLFFAYFLFYSFSKSFQDTNYILEMEFPMILVTGIFLSEIKQVFLRRSLVVALVVIFLVQGIFLISVHDFKGLSQTVSKIPQDKTIMTDFIDPVRYYRQEYLQDTKINNKALLFLEKIFNKPQIPPFNSSIVAYRDYLDGKRIDVDYAILTDFYFERGYALGPGFEKCFEVMAGRFRAFSVFAKNRTLCGLLEDKEA